MSSLHVQQSNLLKNQIQEALKKRLAERDFFFMPQLNQFRRVTPTGFQCVVLNWIPGDNVQILEVYLGVRHDAVEDLAQPFTQGLPELQSNNFTLFTPLGKLFEQPFERFSICCEEDILPAVNAIQKGILSRGISFLERYTRLENVDNLYNTDPETPTLYLHNHLHRCMRAIAIARLSLRPDFERLANAYCQQLKKSGVTDLVLDRYDRLWRFLRTYSMN
ncbi:MAG: hypothetical protein SFV55_25295 [Haliscomenobacter sp.]|uniref:hypothetical protein n=1 Tax=Haliscomenobacter sp. TaxID=2717303 RepID=UPI0029A43009|nr:hypothetical protein [Haliscomenobacter sp.]MDX2071773.1 hypothetical protein [Haliscomenobacter sp.]